MTAWDGHSSQTDKFEVLCNIQADLSTAPYETERIKSGTVYCTRNFDVILLVGLTELKAQIAWIDSVTVSPLGVPPVLTTRSDFPNTRIQKVEKRFEAFFQGPLFPV